MKNFPMSNNLKNQLNCSCNLSLIAGEEEDFELDDNTRDVDDTLGENENESLDKIGEEDGDDVVEGQTQQQGSSDNEDDEDFVDVAESGW